jgi:hypothetical protein
VLQRALNVFDTDITSFERKRFANLSHAPNKAMNINSYISLLGGNFTIEHGEHGDVLRPAGEGSATLTVPDADFILILDADTIVAADYTTKLMRRFRGAGGERLAVVQSPYSTFPGGSEVLQRVAGAQTDIQYLVHQGLTQYEATFWVGANALVRVKALREIAEPAMERGYRVMRYISDRTLIEDTESTIDLALRDWHLFNEPERLAFSLTPPDFGSLLVQRQRWASGGVLLIPKLVKHIARGGGRPRLSEAFMRLHYLISLGPVSMALLIALAVTVDGELRTTYLGLLGATYYLVYMRDLVLLGYDWRDIFRVIALNLLLIPVNVVGMLRSLLQGATGRKPTFARTPKVDRRTPVPVGFLAAEVGLLLFWLGYASYAAARSAVVLAVFLSAHALLLMYALGRYVGLRNGLADMKAQLAPGTRSGV